MTTIAVAIWVVVLGSAASAQEPATGPASVEVRPSEIAVAPWDVSAEALVVLSNTGGKPIVKARLSPALTNDGIVAVVGKPDAGRINGESTHAWRVTVDLRNARIPGSAELELQYTVEGEARHRTSYHTIKFKDAEGEVVESPMEVTFKGSLDSVSEERPARGYIVATNKLDVPVTVTSIRLQSPDPNSFEEAPFFSEKADRRQSPPPFVPFDVPARSSVSQFIELRASPSVQSGKHSVVIDVATAWKRHGRDHSRTYSLPHDMTLGVFFESDLLEVLAVPSFLLLPGWLFLATISVLLKFNWGGAHKPTQWPKLDFPSTEFWVIAITLSAVFAAAYGWQTGRDLLERYGSADLRFMWLSSIAAGAGLYVLMIGWNALQSKNRPTRRDSAMKTLSKMGARKLTLRVQKAEVTLKTAALTAFVIDESDPQVWWVAPQIELAWTGDQSTLPAKAKVIELINSGTAEDLVAALKANRSSVTADFNFTGSVQAPTAFPSSEVKQLGAEPVVVMK